MRFFFGFLATAAFFCFFCYTAEAGGRIDNGSRVHLVYFFEADGVALIPENNKQDLKFVMGKGTYPRDFEGQLVGLKKGDTKVIRLSPGQAYGPYRAELMRRVPKNELPPALALKEGMFLGGRQGQRPMRVAKVLEDSVVFDENHPLAGKQLSYYVQVADIQ